MLQSFIRKLAIGSSEQRALDLEEWQRSGHAPMATTARPISEVAHSPALTEPESLPSHDPISRLHIDSSSGSVSAFGSRRAHSILADSPFLLTDTLHLTVPPPPSSMKVPRWSRPAASNR